MPLRKRTINNMNKIKIIISFSNSLLYKYIQTSCRNHD
ncbi:hypothetical protein CHCC14820_3670 [Bacillus paralicheniformis]|uniref:Uncharacterized protein n=1 Tax=Bacillus paralicheniformis TaxID=1648923 RepID=A0A6I7TZA4_9BACI|nr:hypothetical protein SC10_B2orf04214 [Bacillus paralicheniformis]OLF91211.1 hypothetical protein B4121_2689 [Bacillus paralicheniformis]OLG08217.1 hypothetical protein B4125_2398 [Bacillus paralicheniformis]OLG11121.1 hypothetical protein B4123_2553 [Bacillus paralicheniformis]OLG13105.1 hypothetical protein B4123_0527 [Bacillus paralicheniformis]